jgi:hypothetical protein
MPRLATSFDRVRRARFCVRAVTFWRFARSGGTLPCRSMSSPSSSSQSSRHVGVITGVPWARVPARAVAPQHCALQEASSKLIRVVVRSFDSQATSRLRRRMCRTVAQLFQNVSGFTAQQCDVAVAIHSRQIHPNSQLPRPHLAGGIVRLAADGQ